jgi:kynureninase
MQDPAERGCELSITVQDGAKELVQGLERESAIGDFRERKVIRAAQVSLYNSFHEDSESAQVVVSTLRKSGDELPNSKAPPRR